jgi:hypothetical protein
VLSARGGVLLGILQMGYMDTGPPPHRYDHRPSVPVIEIVLNEAQLQQVCMGLSSPNPNIIVFGCTDDKTAGQCTIYLLPWSHIKAIRRHEIGHCNGWPADHPR